jgi:hypothetical protein
MSESLRAAGDEAGAIACLERGIELKSDWPEAQSRLGVMLASASHTRLRDVRRAVELSESACAATGRHDPEMLANLAGVYAAAGRTLDARHAAAEAATVATAAGRNDLAEQINRWGAGLTALPTAPPRRDSEVGSVAE